MQLSEKHDNPHKGGTEAYLATEHYNEGWNAAIAALRAQADARPVEGEWFKGSNVWGSTFEDWCAFMRMYQYAPQELMDHLTHPEASAPGLSEPAFWISKSDADWLERVPNVNGQIQALRLGGASRVPVFLTRASAATVAEPSKTITQGDDNMPQRGTLVWLIRLLQQLQVHGTASEAKVYINDPTFGRVEVGGALYGIADVELTPNDDDEEAAQQQAEPSECSACDGTGLLQHLSGDPQDAINCFVCALQAEPVGDERAKCQHCHGLGIAAIIGRTEVTCAACDGVGYWHGEESGYGDIDCDACGGTGKQTPADTEAVARALCESVAKRSDRTAGELWTEYRSEFMDDAKAALLAAQSGQRAGITDDMRAAVRFAPSSAHWSQKLVEFFGPDAREGINALEKQLRDALAGQRAGVAEGYVVVPKAPTEKMHVAAVRTIAKCTGNDDFPSRVWAAMIAAAPTPAAQGGV